MFGTNSEFGSILGSALYLSPILTPTLTGDAAEKMIETYKDFDLPRDAMVILIQYLATEELIKK